MKKLFSLFTLVLFSVSMFAAEQTVAYSVSDLYGDDANGTQECTLLDESPVTISVNCDGNNGKIYGTGTEWRIYASNNGVVSVALSEGTLKSVTFTFTLGSGATFSYNGSAITSGEAVEIEAADAELAEFSVTGSKNVAIKSFEVVYDGEAAAVVPTISANPAELSANVTLASDNTAEGELGQVTVAGKAIADTGIEVKIQNESEAGVFSVDVDELAADGGVVTVSYTVIEAGTFTGELLLYGLDAEANDIETIVPLKVVAKEASAAADYNSYDIKDGAKTAKTLEAAGTSASAAVVVIDGTDYAALKFGTGKVKGIWELEIPAGTEKVSFYAAAWNGTTVTLEAAVAVGTVTPDAEIAIDANTGVSNNSPFTLAGDEFSKVELTLSDVASATTLTITPSNNRFVVWGVCVEYSTAGVVTVDVTGVELDKTEATIEVGKTVELVATVAPENASNKKVTWETSDVTIATVEDGVVTGVGEGVATITVKTVDGEFTATATITVEQGEAPVKNAEYQSWNVVNGTATEVTELTASGEKATAAVVKIDGIEYTAIKFGTGSAKGIWELEIPAGTEKVSFYAGAWNGTTVTLEAAVAVGSVTPDAEIAIDANTGVAGNSPFTLAGDEFSKVELTLSDVEEATTLTITPSANRFVVWGVRVESGDTPTGLQNVAVELDVTAPMFNVLGQRVDASYKGVVIQNGQKFLVK